MSQADGLIRLTIDGREVAVPAAKRAYDASNKTQVEIPTTIYDAAVELAVKSGEANPIPILCHREHIRPVAVCRLCVVEVDKEWRLSPACYRPVQNGMVVKTRASSQRVRTTAKVLTQLLMADHSAPCERQRSAGDCELECLAARLNVGPSPFPAPATTRPEDESSLVIDVDHNACILCDRCVRACNEVRDNQVIGRMGKGYSARIAFDLDDPMGDSSCVACGECMVSCPTGALVNRRADTPEDRVMAEELRKHPLFAEVAPKFLELNSGGVQRRRFRPGEIICREGEYGSTAFLIESGTVEVSLQSPVKDVRSLKGSGDKINWGLFGLIRRFTTSLVSGSSTEKKPERYIPVDAPVSLPSGKPVARLGRDDLFGEMTCMNNYPRSATVTAREDCTVLEMRRNILYILQRNRKSRAWLEQRYRERSIDSHLRSIPMFAELFSDPGEFESFAGFLRSRVQLTQLTPGETIFRQGDRADHFYLVRVGFVKVSQRRPGGEQVLNYVGPGGYFGEIGLMSHMPEIAELAPLGVRTATCTALDHVDLVRISGDDFRAIVDRFPQLGERLSKLAVELLKSNENLAQQLNKVSLGDFLQQGLMEAQSLLVLDLEKCTRCDECTRACADAHDGVTRLVREGLRFDKFLVASSCRSCLDPYCMVGCPVGSIVRREGREILIEPWCIGCGKCADNCPYGNINMHGFKENRDDPAQPGRKIAVVQQKATVCDLCQGLSEPSCVYACPHDAAHRMTGKELLQITQRGAPSPGT